MKVKLITRCGCEKEIEIPEYRREIDVFTYPQKASFAATSSLPLVVVNRTFTLVGEETILIYREK